MNLLPSLETRLKGHGRSLFASVATATITCGLLCGSLALIIKTVQLIAEDELETADPLMVTHELAQKIRQEESKPVPLNIISVATSPLKFAQAPQQAKPDPAKETPAPPAPSIVLNELELEELEFENPFAKSKPIVKKTTPTKTKASGKTVARKPSNSNTKKRTASLAKKISKEASLLSRSTPTYPRSARRKGLEGRVIVTVTIASSGKVASSYISKSCGHPSLDNSALAAARRFRFRPAVNGLGQSVSVQRAIPFNFQITG